MILAILAAAAVNSAGPPLRAERTPNLYKVPERCGDAPYKVVDRFGRPVPVKLGDLPKGLLLLAVAKDIDGCPVLTVASDSPAGAIQPMSPGATPKREDAPSNRR